MSSEIDIGAELSLLNSLADDIAKEMDKVEKLVSATNPELKFKVDDRFFRQIAQAINSIRNIVKALNKELATKSTITLELNTDAVSKFKSQMIDVFQEALTKNYDTASALGRKVGDEIRRAFSQSAKDTGVAPEGNAPARNKSGGKGASSDAPSLVDGQSGAEATRALIAYRESVAEVQTELNSLLKETRLTFRGLADVFNTELPGAARAMENGGRLFARSSEVFVKSGLQKAKKEAKALSDRATELSEVLGRLKTTQIADKDSGEGLGGLPLNGAETAELASVMQRLGTVVSTVETAERNLLDTEKLRTNVLNSQRQVVNLTATANEALSDSFNPYAVTLAIRSFQNLEQNLTSNERRARQYVDSLNALEEELLAIRAANEFKLKQADVSGDTDRINILQNEKKLITDVVALLDRQQNNAANSLDQLAKQREISQGVLSSLRNEEKVRGGMNKLITDARIEAAKYTNELENQVSLAQKLSLPAKNAGAIGGSELVEVKTVLSSLDKLQKVLPARVEGFKKALQLERERLAEEFKKGVGRYQRDGKIVSPEQIDARKADKANLDAREADIQVFAANAKALIDSVADRRIDFGQVIKEGDDFERVTGKVEKLGASVRALQATGTNIGTFGFEDFAKLDGADLILKDFDAGLKTTTRSIAELGSQLSAAYIDQKISEDQYNAQTGALKNYAAAAKAAGSATAGISRTEIQEFAKSTEFLGEGVDKAKREVVEFTQRFQSYTRDLRAGGDATLNAVVGFSNLRREMKAMETGLEEQISSANRLRAAMGGLSAEQEAQAAAAQRSLNAVRELGRGYDRNAQQITQVAKVERDRGKGFQLYNAQLIESVKSNLRFANSLTIITSGLFILRTAFTEIIEESRGFSRTLTVLQSDTLSTAEAFAKFKDAAKDAAVEFGVEISQVSEVVKQFGSAGLTVEESLAGLNSALRLIIATNADAEQVGRQLAGIYNVFGDSLGAATDQAEAFARITDTLTSVYRNNQAELDEIVQGLSFAAATGKLAGFTFEEISGFLAVLNDNLIKSGKAGRGLQVVFSQFAAKTEQFEKAFNFKVDPNASVASQFIAALEAARVELGDTEVATGKLQELFAQFNLRGARSFAVLAQNVDVVRENIERLNDSAGTAALLADLVQNELANSFDRAKEAALDMIRGAVEPMQQIFISITNTLIQFKEGFDAIPASLKAVGGAFVAMGLGAYTLNTMYATVQLLTGAMEVVRDATAGAGAAFSSLFRRTAKTEKAVDNLAASWEALDRNSKNATSSLNGAASASSRVAVGLSAALVLLPVAIGIFGALQTSVADVNRELSKLESQALDLKETNDGLAEFERRFKKVAALVEGGGKDSEVAGNAIRRVLTQSGKAYVDLGVIAGKTNRELAEGFDTVSKQIEGQLVLQRELLKVREEAQAFEEKNSNQKLLEEKYAPSFGIEGDKESVNLAQLVRTRKALEGISSSAANAEIKAKALRQALNAGSFDTITAAQLFEGADGPSFSIEDAAALKAFGDSLGGATAAGIETALEAGQVEAQLLDLKKKISGQLVTVASELDAELDAAIGQKLTSQQGQSEIERILGSSLAGKFGLTSEARAEIAQVLADQLQNVISEASSKIEVPDIDPVKALFEESLALYETLDTNIGDDTFKALITGSDRLGDSLVRQNSLIKESIANFRESAQAAEVSVNRGNLQRAIQSQIAQLPPESLSKLSKDYGFTGGDVFTNEGLKKAEEELSDIELKVRFNMAPGARGTEPLKQQLRELAQKGLTEALTDKAVLGTAADTGEEIGKNLLDLRFIGVFLEDINLLSDNTANSVGDFTRALQKLEALDTFKTFLKDDFGKTLAQTFEDQLKSDTTANSLEKQYIDRDKFDKDLQYAKEERLKFAKDLGVEVEDITSEVLGRAFDANLQAQGLQDIATATEEQLETAKAQTLERALQTEEGKKLLDIEGKIRTASAGLINSNREITVEVLRRRGAEAEINQEISQQARNFDGLYSRADDAAKRSVLRLKNQRAILKAQQELTGSTSDASLKAANELRQIEGEILEQRREMIKALRAEDISRLETVAQAEELLSSEKAIAVVRAQLQAFSLRINDANRDLAIINSRRVSTEKELLRRDSDRLVKYKEIVTASAALFEIEKKLKDKLKDNNDLYNERLGLLRQIESKFGENLGQIESQLSDALGQSLENDRFGFAAIAAQELGESFSYTYALADQLIPLLVEGGKAGTVAFEGFGQTVATIGGQLRGLQGELDKVDGRIKDVLQKQIDRSQTSFNQFLDADKLDEAQKSLDRLGSAYAEFYADDGEAFIRNRELLLEYQTELDKRKLSQEDKIKLELEGLEPILDGLKQLRDYLRELTDQQWKVGILADDEISAILKGATAEGVRETLTALQAVSADLKTIAGSKTSGNASGDVKGYATGGFLPGYGGGDKIPAMLEAGEFVMPKEAVSKFGVGFFENLRGGNVPGYKDGGLIAPLGSIRGELEKLGATSPAVQRYIVSQLDEADYSNVSLTTFASEKAAKKAMGDAEAQYNDAKAQIIVRPSLFKDVLAGKNAEFTNRELQALVHEIYHHVQAKAVISKQKAIAEQSFTELTDKGAILKDYVNLYSNSGSFQDFLKTYLNKEFDAFTVQKHFEAELEASSKLGPISKEMSDELRASAYAWSLNFFDPDHPPVTNGKNAYQHYTKNAAKLWKELGEHTGNVKPIELAKGGQLPGYGGGDKIPAMLEAGEFVMPKEAVSKFGGGFFEALRSGNVPGYATGGSVSLPGQYVGSAAQGKNAKGNITLQLDMKSATEQLQEELEAAGVEAFNSRAFVGAASVVATLMSDSFAKALDFSFVLEGAEAVSAALEVFRDAVNEANSTLSTALGGSETALRNNTTGFLAYVDQVQQAEQSYFQQRIEASKALKAQLEETENLFKTTLGESVTGSLDGIASALGGLSVGSDDLFGNIDALAGAASTSKARRAASFENVNRAGAAQSQAYEALSAASLETELAEAFGSSSDFDNAIEKNIEAAETYAKTTDRFDKAVAANRTTVAAFDKLVTDNLSNLLQGLAVNLGTGLLQLLTSGVGQLFSAVLNTGSIDQLLEGFDRFATNLIENGPEIVQAMIAGANQFIEALVEKLPAILDTLVTQLPVLLNGLVDILSDSLPIIIAQVGEALPELIKGLVPGLADLFVVLVDNLPGLVQGIAAAVPVLVGELLQALPKILISLMQLPITAGVAIITGLIKTLPGALLDLFKSIPSLIVDGLEQLFVGLLDGIKRLFGKKSDEQKDVREELKDRGFSYTERKAVQFGLFGARKRLTQEEREYFQTLYPSKKFQTGGFVPGSGVGDIVPAMLEPGEFVIPKQAVKAYGSDFFESIRRSKTVPGYALGGIVGRSANLGGIVKMSAGSVDSSTNINLSASVNVSGTASKADKRRAAKETVKMIDEELAKLKRNRKSKFDGRK